MACEGKHKYMTEATAQAKLKSLIDMSATAGRKRTERSVYKCPHCGFWHLTKQKQERR